MPIPPFQLNGLLPPFIGTDAKTADRSPYFVTISDMAVRFGTTPHRKQLIRNFIAYRQLLTSDGYVDGLQFVDGSFVEEVERIQNRDPGDIDVFSFLSAPSRYLADANAWTTHGFDFWKNEIVDRDKNKQRFALDTYAILMEETDLAGLMKNIMYWYSLFSHQRTTFAWKGFAAMPLDSAADAAVLSTLGST